MKKTRIGNFKKIIIVLGIIILPVIYSYFYLNGFWDPYNKLDEIPVAIVNQDKCDNNCKSDLLVDKIVDSKAFDFKVVSENQANKGLINKKYFSVIKIPENFTSSINSVSSGDRKNIEIYYSPNLKTSYLVAQFTNEAVKKIANSLELEIATTAVSELSNSVTETFDGTKTISNGLGTISNGTTNFYEGTKELASGSKYLNNKYKEFDNGINKASTGMNEINSKMPELVSGTAKLNSGLTELDKKVSAGASEFNKETMLVLKGTSFENNVAINKLKTKNANLTADYIMLENIMGTTPAFSHIYDECANNLDTVNAKIDSSSNLTTEQCLEKFNTIKVEYANNFIEDRDLILLLDGDKDAVDNLIEVGTSMSELATGVNKLKVGSDQLLGGVNKLNNGTYVLNNGLNKLNTASTTMSSGIDEISNGSSKLESGSKSLDQGVKSAKKAVDDKIDSNSKSISDLKGLSDYTKDSVKVKQKNVGEVNNYGTFFAPYFMSLSLWVGGLLILMGLYYDPEKRFKFLCKKTSSRGKRLFYYNVIGICQAIILAFILKLLLGFEVTNIWLFYGTCILISEVFLSIIMFLFFNFKDVGKFLALLFLVIQLASCGGTFPIQTEPAFYKAVYPFMPMTYSVDLLRESFVNINSKFLVKDMTILVSILVVFTLLTLFTSLLKNRKEIKEKIETKIEIKKEKRKNAKKK